MNKFTVNDINVLAQLVKMGVRHKKPCNIMPLMDSLQKYYYMSREEIFKSLEFLEHINYIETKAQFLSLTEQFDVQTYENRKKTMGNNYTLDVKKATRFRILEKVYNETGGSENTILDMHEIGEVLNLPSDLNEITFEYLVGERLLEYKALGGCVGITHYGIQQYEQAISAPEEESKYFPPVKFIKNIVLEVNSIENSQIQIGTNYSNQTMNTNSDFNDLRTWLQNLEETLIKENKQELFEKISDDIEIIKANINTEKPNKKYIGIALNAIRDILIGITANYAFQELLKKLPYLIP
jgi:hypothetical protein